jgi:hypothetical protein
LGIDPERLREGVNEYREQAVGGNIMRRHIRCSPTARRGSIRPYVRRRRNPKAAAAVED